MRYPSSCSVCKLRKKRCITSDISGTCTYCHAKQLVCDVVQAKVRCQTTALRHAVPPRNRTSINTNLNTEHGPLSDVSKHEILNLSVCDDLITLYFEIFHNKQQILFQRRQFLTEKQNGQVPDYTVLAIIALTARFSTHEYFRDLTPCQRADTYLRLSLKSFNDREDVISIQALQGCVLLSFVCLTEGYFDRESLLAAQAIRMVHVMKLSKRSYGDIVQQETRIRLFWQVSMMDSWNSAKDGMSSQLTANPNTPKPLDEKRFEALSVEDESIDDILSPETNRNSIWAQVVQLTDTLTEVTQLLTTAVEYPGLHLQVEGRTQALTWQLDNWLKFLPATLHDTSENFAVAEANGTGRELAVVHLIYHHQCQLLYFPYLSRYTPEHSDRQVTEYVFRCRAHGEALSKLMWTTNTTAGMECLWSPVNGHLLAVASAVLLHTLIFGQNQDQVATVKRLLEQNFVMLLQFKTYWPTLQHTMSRLQMFHQFCGRSSGQRNFQMDPWMLSFLIDYSAILEKRVEADIEAVSPQSVNSGEIRWEDLTNEQLVRNSGLNAHLSFS